MADSNNPEIETYLFVAYFDRNKREKREKKLSHLQARLFVKNFSLSAEPKLIETTANMQLTAVYSQDKLLQVHKSKETKLRNFKTIEQIENLPCVEEASYDFATCWVDHNMAILGANSHMMIYEGLDKVLDSRNLVNSEKFIVRPVYSKGRFSTYGRALRVTDGHLFFINSSNECVILPLLQLKGGKKIQSAEQSAPYFELLPHTDLVEFDYADDANLYLLKENGNIIRRNLIIKTSVKKGEAVSQSMKLKEGEKEYKKEEDSSNGSLYYSCVTKIEGENLLALSYVQIGYEYSGIELLCTKKFVQVFDRKMENPRAAANPKTYTIHFVRSHKIKRYTLLIAAMVYEYLSIYLVHRSALHVLKEYYQFDGSYFNNFALMKKSIFVAGFKFLKQIEMTF